MAEWDPEIGTRDTGEDFCEEVLIGMKLKNDLTVENKVGWVPLGEEGRQLIRIKVTSEMFRN